MGSVAYTPETVVENPVETQKPETSTMTVEKSTHKVEVVQITEMRKHEQADTLSIAKLNTGDEYSRVVRTSDWKVGDIAAWIPPDSIVDTKRPEFAFLASKSKSDGTVRIRAQKLRGVVSYGLLVPAPKDSKLGDDVATILGVEHYDPEEQSIMNEIVGKKLKITSGEVAKAPSGNFPKYDVDAYLKYGKKVFVEGEMVTVTEKLHGANSRYTFVDGEMHYGSRTEWKKEFASKPTVTLEYLLENAKDEETAKKAWDKIQNWKPSRSMWWHIVLNIPAIKVFCEAHPGWCLYGEAYGFNKGFHYDATQESGPKFRAFDILRIDGSWVDRPDFVALTKEFNVPICPVIHESVAFNFEELAKLADGNSLIGSHIREGVVIEPVKNRWDERLGRVKLKVINPNY